MTCLNREAFLKKLFLMYPANFTTENAPIWKEAYEMVLPENLNFDKLFYKLVKDYKSIATAPAPAWFEDYKETCKEKQGFEPLFYDKTGDSNMTVTEGQGDASVFSV